MKAFEIISDFEELTKIKTFQEEGLQQAVECTLERISYSLQNEYIENINEKLTRWIDVTIALYFQNVMPVKFYLQAKMLYRDGYYEAAITISRSICEMICYHLLNEQNHPFGSIREIELENFRTLANFLAIPKIVEKTVFEQQLINLIKVNDDRNFVKSSYIFDNKDKVYHFKIVNGKKAETLNKFFRIFDDVKFTLRDSFPGNSFQLINQVYDHGNTYVHARKSANSAKEDARKSLFSIGLALFDLFGIKEMPLGQNVVSGYADFKDICKGMGFAMDIYFTIEDAQRGYYNLPSKQQMDRIMLLEGQWQGQWKEGITENRCGELSFYVDGEYLRGDFTSEERISKDIGIKLFGDIFRLIVYNMDKRKPLYIFSLEWLNEKIIIGTCDLNDGIKRIAQFQRVSIEGNG